MREIQYTNATHLFPADRRSGYLTRFTIPRIDAPLVVECFASIGDELVKQLVVLFALGNESL